MPKRVDGASKSETIQLRLTPETRQRCNKARLSGARKRDAEAAFLGFLIELGIAKYEKAILPVEIGEDENTAYASEKPASKKEQAG